MDIAQGGQPPLLVLTGITRRFGGLTAVEDLDLTVDAHEIVGLIGPNGAGKTTAFNLITGFDRPTRGRIAFDGTDITRWSAHRRARHGMVRTFQGHDTFPALTVRRNIEIAVTAARRVHRRRAVTARADELLGLVGIARFADHVAGDVPHAIAGLVGVAMAMALEPRILLLDEPLAGSNMTEATAILDAVETVRSTGTAVLLVEHNMRAVMERCERIVVLHHGRVLAEGDPEAIQADPQVVEAYLGSEIDTDVA